MSEKTNASRKLDSMKVQYKEYVYECPVAVSGVEVAEMLGLQPDNIFKTLVTTGKSGAHYVFMIPVAKELDLKKAAAHVGEKSIEMLKSKDLLSLTGYIHGGCSPIGMKKFFTTTIHSSSEQFETIIFSGGRIGYQIELSLSTLSKVIKFSLTDLIKEENR